MVNEAMGAWKDIDGHGMIQRLRKEYADLYETESLKPPSTNSLTQDKEHEYKTRIKELKEKVDNLEQLLIQERRNHQRGDLVITQNESSDHPATPVVETTSVGVQTGYNLKNS
eukprot:CAMPEP_0117426208 /NCGR_PEP_ID=MMETSP0758-20121206/6360_1 /TAXON_ID=63605 /ORGANISM="Percolomonas cosmopolitus, Strain AE-1 (ATCC 50343)" /LENGTH=112 /DNA_ID=CAMNT_0005211223 /DNA_START=2023 /DNA_END=2357 /DNA_ORIENTATION=-